MYRVTITSLVDDHKAINFYVESTEMMSRLSAQMDIPEEKWLESCPYVFKDGNSLSVIEEVDLDLVATSPNAG